MVMKMIIVGSADRKLALGMQHLAIEDGGKQSEKADECLLYGNADDVDALSLLRGCRGRAGSLHDRAGHLHDKGSNVEQDKNGGEVLCFDSQYLAARVEEIDDSSKDHIGISVDP